MKLTKDQCEQVARIVSNKNAYIDISNYGGGGQFDDEEWLEIAQDFAAATIEVLGTAGLEAIVRDLASGSPTAASEIHGDPFCTLCDADLDVSPEHDDDCPWLRATEWVAEHPEWVDVTDRVIPGTVEIQPGRPES